MIKKLLFVVMFLTFSLQIKAEINQSTIFVLGSLDKETKQLFKETIYDQNGQLVSGSLMDYAIPRASDVPNFQFSYNEVICKTNLLGVKGAGEAGAIGAPPAIINAVCNALNISHIDMPAKPEKLWKVMNSQ